MVVTFYIDEVSELLVKGESFETEEPVAFSIGEDMEKLAIEIEKLESPSPVTKLEGAYVTVIPSENNNDFVMVTPIIPDIVVGGTNCCNGIKAEVKPTKSFAIYQVSNNRVNRVPYE